MTLRLYDWAPSPFCLKVRAILDYKALPYERINALGKPLFDMWKRGATGKFPTLEIDGELVCDSTDIAYALEARAPEPRIVPRDGRERALCHALEDWADESLYFIGLYYQWREPEGRKMVPRAFGRSIVGRAAYRAFDARVARQLAGQGTARKSERHIRRDLERQLDAIEGLLEGRAFLLGDAPMLCDFALLGQVVYLARTPVGEREMETRPRTRAFMERMKALRARAETTGAAARV